MPVIDQLGSQFRHRPQRSDVALLAYGERRTIGFLSKQAAGRLAEFGSPG